MTQLSIRRFKRRLYDRFVVLMVANLLALSASPAFGNGQDNTTQTPYPRSTIEPSPRLVRLLLKTDGNDTLFPQTGVLQRRIAVEARELSRSAPGAESANAANPRAECGFGAMFLGLGILTTAYFGFGDRNNDPDDPTKHTTSSAIWATVGVLWRWAERS